MGVGAEDVTAQCVQNIFSAVMERTTIVGWQRSGILQGSGGEIKIYFLNRHKIESNDWRWRKEGSE